MSIFMEVPHQTLLWEEKMATAVAESHVSPPYVPFKTLDGFVSLMRSKGLPHQIDRSVMPKMSGIMQKQLLQALRFLGLVNESDEVTDAMKQLVGATEPDAIRKKFATIVESSYARILGGVNVASATYKQLADRFRDEGKVDGDTLTKSIRFYLKALSSAGLAHSSHLLMRQKRTTTAKKSLTGQRPKGSGTATEEELEDDELDDGAESKHSAGAMRIPLYFPGKSTGSITVPDSLSSEDCDMIDAILRAIAKRRSTKSE